MFASGSTSVKASGNDTIVGTETFNSLEKVMAVQYDNVIYRSSKNIGSIIMRYYHHEILSSKLFLQNIWICSYDPLSFLYRTSSQTVKPDSALGNASTDSKGNAWYNISKINNTPVI